MNAKGTFDVTVTTEPPYDASEGVTLARSTVQKRFSGPLDATSVVHMLSARTSVPTSAGYVGIERVTGALDGKRGTFVLQHSGHMSGGSQSMTITVVPDSGTGELSGISGRLGIQIVDGKHHYEFHYELGV